MKKNAFIGVIIFFLLSIPLSHASFVMGSERNMDFAKINANVREKIRPLKRPPIKPPKKTPTPTTKQSPTPTAIPSVTPSPTPSVTPTPQPPLRKIPHGNVTFTVSGGNQGGPALSRGSINPYDPDFGVTQKIQVYADSSQSDQSMQITVKTDHGIVTFPMSIATTSGTKNIWEGSWTVADSYLYTYKATIKATGANGTTIVPITLR